MGVGSASVSLESRRLLLPQGKREIWSGEPPQSLWNRGDCFRKLKVVGLNERSASVSLESRRLLPPGITHRQFARSASVSLESRRLLPERVIGCSQETTRLSLFGIAATASGWGFLASIITRPPQSLWNRGDCFIDGRAIVGAAFPPQSLWNRGDCFADAAVTFSGGLSASVSLESRRLLLMTSLGRVTSVARLSLFGIAATASPLAAVTTPVVWFRLSLFGIAATASTDEGD